MNKLSLIILILFFSCKGQNDNKKLSAYHEKYFAYYDKTLAAIEDKNAENFKINYDSAKIYLDSLLINKPNNITLLRQKLALLQIDNDLKGMIDTYNKLIKNDSLNLAQKQDLKFGRFFCMAVKDSILYKKEISEYYKDLQKKEPKISVLLSNLDPYKDQPEIYKRMGISYYFEGKAKTLKDFEPLSNKIPYKFKYVMIKENLKDPVEFLKSLMGFPVEYNWK
ncbi:MULTISPECIES: hypothetical protein [Chryseobacterium]|uniref:hypothetical protein n=1 Tax=Chryseobacterium sp. R2A-55 TaxID=2744445 RepID=UPI001F2615D9|nr:hypothetical protein [Chryseobacterium sp. R2A-55]